MSSLYNKNGYINNPCLIKFYGHSYNSVDSLPLGLLWYKSVHSIHLADVTDKDYWFSSEYGLIVSMFYV